MNLVFDIPQAGPTWSLVRKIRDEVFALLVDQPRNMRECAAMAASELAENALKYGIAVVDAPVARLDVRVTNQEIVIEVRNGIKEPEQAERVSAIVDRLESGASPEELYVQRLLDLLREPSMDESRLGLLRIAHEGEFRLECRSQGDTLLVRATRKLSHG